MWLFAYAGAYSLDWIMRSFAIKLACVTQTRVEVAEHVGGTAYRIARTQPSRSEPTPQLQCCRERRALGGTHTRRASQLASLGRGQTQKTLMLLQEPRGERERIATRSARAQEQRDQLGLREGLRAERVEAFARSVTSGKGSGACA